MPLQFTPPEIMSRYRAAWTIKQNWAPLLKEAYTYSRPGVNPYYENGSGDPFSTMPRGGQSRRHETLSTILEDATEALINRVLTDYFPSKARWADIGPNPRLPEAEAEAVELLLAPVALALFGALHDSNWDRMSGPVTSDLIVAGTGFNGRRYRPDTKEFIFTPIQQAHMAIDQDSEGNPVAYYYKSVVTHDELRAMYPNANLPEKKTGDDGKQRKMDLVRACMLNRELEEPVWEFNILVTGGEGADSQSEPHVLVDPVVYPKDRCPYAMVRWSRASDEIYGRGPVLAALPEFRTLNSATRALLQTSLFASLGIYAVGAGSAFNLQDKRIVPGGAYTMQDVNDLKRLDTPTSTPDLLHMINTSTQNIRNVMLYDRLPDPREKGNPMSAEEIVQRRKEARVDYGVAGANLDAWGDDNLRFMLSHMLDDPDSGFGELADDLKTAQITLNSPLQTNQKSVDMMRMMEFVQAAKPMFDPMKFGAVLDEMGMLRKMANLARIGPEFIRDINQANEEYQKQVQQLMEMEAQKRGQAEVPSE